MLKQWKTGVKGLSKRQIEEKFRLADTSGNGRLNEREFKRLLLSFGIKLSATDQDLLLRRFDVDGDGELDLREFVEFINKDINGIQLNQQDTKGSYDNSLSSTIPYDQIQAAPPLENKVAEITIESLLEKQKAIENKVGKKYFAK